VRRRKRELSIVRSCVASGLTPNVKGNVADKLRRYTRIRRPFVASEPVSDVVFADHVVFVVSGLAADVKGNRHSGESRNPVK